MPTYEYACAACKHEWEVEQRISEDALKKCPKCHKNKARRLIGSGNFILKGGGWYSDLYSSSSNRPAKAKSGSDEGSSSSSSSPSPTSTASETSSSPKDPAPEPKGKKKPKAE